MDTFARDALNTGLGKTIARWSEESRSRVVLIFTDGTTLTFDSLPTQNLTVWSAPAEPVAMTLDEFLGTPLASHNAATWEVTSGDTVVYRNKKGEVVSDSKPTPFKAGEYTEAELVRIYGQTMFKAMWDSGRIIPSPSEEDADNGFFILKPDANPAADEK